LLAGLGQLQQRSKLSVQRYLDTGFGRRHHDFLDQRPQDRHRLTAKRLVLEGCLELLDLLSVQDGKAGMELDDIDFLDGGVSEPAFQVPPLRTKKLKFLLHIRRVDPLL